MAGIHAHIDAGRHVSVGATARSTWLSSRWCRRSPVAPTQSMHVHMHISARFPGKPRIFGVCSGGRTLFGKCISGYTHVYFNTFENSGRTPPPTVGAMVSSMWYLHRNDPSDRADDGGELLSSTVLYIHSPSPSPYTPTCTSLSSVSTHPSIEAPPSTQDSPRPYPCMPIASPNAYPCPWSPPILL